MLWEISQSDPAVPQSRTLEIAEVRDFGISVEERGTHLTVSTDGTMICRKLASGGMGSVLMRLAQGTHWSLALSHM